MYKSLSAKALCLTLILLSLIQTGFCEEVEGCFVPNYQSFMSGFSKGLAAVDESYLDTLTRFISDDGEWEEVASSMRDRFVLIDEANDISISTDEHWMQLLLFSSRLPAQSSDTAIDAFSDIATSALRSILVDSDEEEIKRIFENCHVPFDSNRDRDEHFWHCDIYEIGSSVKDGYVYFFVRFLDSSNERTEITPYGYESK